MPSTPHTQPKDTCGSTIHTLPSSVCNKHVFRITQIEYVCNKHIFYVGHNKCLQQTHFFQGKTDHVLQSLRPKGGNIAQSTPTTPKFPVCRGFDLDAGEEQDALGPLLHHDEITGGPLEDVQVPHGEAVRHSTNNTSTRSNVRARLQQTHEPVCSKRDKY